MAGGDLIHEPLQQFLFEQRERRFNWATTNCALWVSDWIRTASGIDPAVGMRGRAASAEQWKALLDDEGGFIPIIGHAMDACGFERTQSPARGDPMIVSVPISLCDRMPVVGVVAAICLAGADRHGWPMSVTRSVHGLHYERFSFVTAWRLIWRDSVTVH